MPSTTAVDFEQDVIEASHAAPVVVDFWASWCQPCRVLGPRLEALAEEQYGGAWSLVKVDTEAQPELAQQHGVRGLPTVKLFHEGAVVDEFTGALPERALRQWFDDALPTEEKARLERARAALAEGNTEAATPLLREALEDNPGDAETQVLLSRALVFEEPQEAAALAARPTDLADPDLRQTRDAVETVARLLSLSEDDSNAHSESPSSGALPEDPPADYLRAIDALLTRDFDAALERFIAALRTDRAYDDDGARRACVALFTLLGREHPATQKHRPVFDRALY